MLSQQQEEPPNKLLRSSDRVLGASKSSAEKHLSTKIQKCADDTNLTFLRALHLLIQIDIIFANTNS